MEFNAKPDFTAHKALKIYLMYVQEGTIAQLIQVLRLHVMQANTVRKKCWQLYQGIA